MLTAAKVGRRAGAAAASGVAMIKFAGRELSGGVVGCRSAADHVAVTNVVS